MSESGLATMSPAMADVRNYTRSIVRFFAPYIGQSLLEIGIGFGNFREHLPPLERHIAVDIDPEAEARARRRGMSHRYVLADVAAADFPAELAGESIDTVLCVNVLEHVGDDRAAIQNMLAVLTPGGYMLLLVPAHRCLFSDLDRLAGHMRRYGKPDLKAALQNMPCQTVKLEYFNPLGAMGWWLNRLIPTRDIACARIRWQVVVFDRVVLPVSLALGCLTKQLFGQSLICVARRT